MDTSNVNDKFEEKRAFKNILIHFMDLPVTPPVVSYWGREQNFIGFTRSECGWAETPLSISDIRTIQTVPDIRNIQNNSPLVEGVPQHHQRYDTRDHMHMCLYPNCAKKFGTRTNLEWHTKERHQKNKRFHCTVSGCEYSRQGGMGFHRKEHWKRHMSKMHNVEGQHLPDPAEIDVEMGGM
ncbi:hypothetical protein CEP51_005171 [Fusarium floridanum]|uniref:C2H2-type domain-containing protein n=1 Tax=Fusarium floridanum TaxID=1325733 RepID=A0A428RY88_9HYPO|nr:hypothetical protein CEP51_005171 [Fusarium floridanum]